DKFVKIITSKLPPLLVLILGLVGIALYLFIGAKPPQIWPALVISAFAILIAFGLYYQQQRFKSAWSRPILQLPLKQSTIEEVFNVFDDALKETHRVIHEFRSIDSAAAVVRTNIFLPTIEGAASGDVCSLRIPTDNISAQDGLQRNMNSD